jgi:hypothetical protein
MPFVYTCRYCRRRIVSAVELCGAIACSRCKKRLAEDEAVQADSYIGNRPEGG